MIVLAAKALCYFAQGSENVVGNLDSSRAQKIAIRRFPEIGIPGSFSNKRFLDSVEEAKRLRPRIFEKSDWPLIIASENESLKTLENSLRSNDLNLIQKELAEFRFKDKAIEGKANKIGVLLSKSIIASRNHEKNWISTSAAISTLKKNAQINENYVPFRSGDRSHLVKAENQRREAEELAGRFKSQSEILRTEETRLRHEISELVAEANQSQKRVDEINRGVAASKPIVKNDQFFETAEHISNQQTVKSSQPVISNELNAARNKFLALFFTKAAEVSDTKIAQYKHDYDELMSACVYSSTVGSIETHNANLRRGNPKAFFYQGLIYLSGYAFDKTLQKELGGKTYLQLSVLSFGKCEGDWVIANVIEALAIIFHQCDAFGNACHPDQSIKIAMNLLSKAKNGGSVWAKELELLLTQKPSAAGSLAGAELKSVLYLFGIEGNIK